MADEQPRRAIANPWPRLILAAVLTVWGGSNMWTAIFRWQEIAAPANGDRAVGMILSVLVTILPVVVAIYLVWTILVGPDDPRFNAKRRGSATGPRGRKSRR